MIIERPHPPITAMRALSYRHPRFSLIFRLFCGFAAASPQAGERRRDVAMALPNECRFRM
ncbi:hypothetical protein KIH77_08415 [Bifidobacterium sp. 82T24]|uniref:Uncharacterized protein n=1 Tax=Bifidobacterium saimiriisciurei TaxID=2661627 RepID=A0ABX0C9W1_9BIFI|nr:MULTISPECIES: hypothetical protein [Bifidobacterium]MBW3088748.1 hypothetical protein [Bifidobacterium pluvialisilvae]NEG96369.1 hypothetical protein [Bifidobacterium sp. SMB2]NEH10999.1 hypothetical protein [Bifidobacterium saimiriisciurei]